MSICLFVLILFVSEKYASTTSSSAYDAFEEARRLSDNEQELGGDAGHLINSSFGLLLSL